MAKCWCGKTHPRGSILNGEVKHFVMNWKLYQFRHKDGKGEEENEEIAAPEPVTVG